MLVVEIRANSHQNHPPKTLAEANQVILLQQEKIDTIEQQYANLQQQLNSLLRSKYGKSSEKILENYGQTNLFDKHGIEIEKAGEDLELNQKPDPTKIETITYSRNKRNGHRNIPDDLPRVRIEHTLKDLSCPCGCGNQLYKISEVVTEQLEIVPAKIYVKQHVRFKYAGCKHQNKVVTAPMPNQPIDKGFAGPGLLADVLVNKYDDHLPLYRQSERLLRHGIDIPKNTLCGWVMQCADILEPIVEAMRPDLFLSPKIHTDDTIIPVQKEGGGEVKKGRLWGYLGCGPPCVIYDYSPDRRQIWADEFLKGYEGYLQADAYTGYDKIYATNKIIEVGCMAHARRKFFDVVQSNNKAIKTKIKSGVAVTALNYIGKLYRIERQIKNLDPIAKKALRKRKAKPILKDYRGWLLRQSTRVLPKSPLGQAIRYTLKNWIALNRYLADSILDIDNNKAERLMRPVAIGRKNWSFAGNDRGGRAAAIIYSLIESCKVNDINPYDYLRDILTRLPNTLNRDIKSLLPYIWKPPTA